MKWILLASALILSLFAFDGCYSYSYHRDAGSEEYQQDGDYRGRSWDRIDSHGHGYLTWVPDMYYYERCPYVPYGYATPCPNGFRPRRVLPYGSGHGWGIRP